MTAVIGSCSLCGGRVTVPTAWWAIVPPTPTCESCGATARAHGPVIEMQPAPRTFTTNKLEILHLAGPLDHYFQQTLYDMSDSPPPTNVEVDGEDRAAAFRANLKHECDGLDAVAAEQERRLATGRWDGRPKSFEERSLEATTDFLEATLKNTSKVVW